MQNMSPYERVMVKAKNMDDAFLLAWREGIHYGEKVAKEEVLGFLRRTGASAETLIALLEKGEQ